MYLGLQSENFVCNWDKMIIYTSDQKVNLKRDSFIVVHDRNQVEVMKEQDSKICFDKMLH